MSSHLLILVAQIGVPLALLTWQALGRDSHAVEWTLKHGAVWSYVYATTIAGLWLSAPWYFPHVLMVISIALAARMLPGALRLRQPAPGRQWRRVAIRLVIAAAAAATLFTALRSRTPPRDTIVELTFPLTSGHYYVANGGSTALTNTHVRMLSSGRFIHYRGSSYGVDIVALNVLGTHARGLAPRNPVEYEIFGRVIYPPCEGVVIRAEDGLPDLTPPDADRMHAPGNFVMLECGDSGEFHVLLAHMSNGSVSVHPGDYVTLDTPLGAVGNSGNSGEPHLHVHAQRPGRIWDLFSGDPLPIRFDGRYLVRNDRVSIARRAEIIDD